MGVLNVTVIGQDLFKIVKEKFELAGINVVNEVKSGMLGNLKLLTYRIEMDELEIIPKRKKFLELVSEDKMRLMAMYVAGDWMRIFIMRPIRI